LIRGHGDYDQVITTRLSGRSRLLRPDLNEMVVDLNEMVVDLNEMVVDLNEMVVDLNKVVTKSGISNFVDTFSGCPEGNFGCYLDFLIEIMNKY